MGKLLNIYRHISLLVKIDQYELYNVQIKIKNYGALSLDTGPHFYIKDYYERCCYEM